MEDYWTECQYYDIVWVCFMFGNCNHCCFCCGHPFTMLGVSLFISCKNKIQCVCVCEKKNGLALTASLSWSLYHNAWCSIESLIVINNNCDSWYFFCFHSDARFILGNSHGLIYLVPKKTSMTLLLLLSPNNNEDIIITK